MSNKKTIQMYLGSGTVFQALFSESIHANGIGNMVISRRTSTGLLVGVVFLCDQYCLGVKDCFAFLENDAGYRATVDRIREREHLVETDAGTLKAYVLGLVRWARDIGFDPASDYRTYSQIFQGIPENPDADFQYGRDGAPFYINGPNETPAQVTAIVKKLLAYKERTGNDAHFSIIGPVAASVPPEILEGAELRKLE